MPAKLGNSTVATELGKVCFHFSPKEGQMPKTIQITLTALISHAVSSKVMLKILQAKLEQYKNQELSDV